MMAVHEVNTGAQNQVVIKLDNSKEEQQDLDDNLHVYPVNKQSSMNATLDTRELWKQFETLGTEMIVTRRGRRMFPPIKVTLHDLKPNSFYVLLMDLVPVDKYRYKYQNSKWVKCFEEACSSTRLYIHPESPALGSYWMENVVSFYKLKLTNNQLDKQGHIIVNSMHCYQPRLHIVESNDRHNLNWENFHTIIFPGTQFTTVTAYQNDKITQLKIENNPFAKGFRHPMSRNRSRPIKYTYPPRSGSETGSDDGVVYCSNPIVCPSLADIDKSNEQHKASLKRHSSGSDEEIGSPSLKKPLLANHLSESNHSTQVTFPILPTHKTSSVSSTHSPMYLAYTNKDCHSSPTQSTRTLLPSHHFSSQHMKVPQNGLTSCKAFNTPFQIIQISNPATTFGKGSVVVDQKSTKENYTNHCSSSDSSDSESEGDQSSPKSSPRTALVHSAPPPLIPTSMNPGNIITLPTSQHQNIFLPQGLIATGNGTQQILVPVTIPHMQGKANILLQPAIIGPTQTTNSNLFQLAYPGTETAAVSSHSIVQTLPLIVNGKQGDMQPTIPAVTNGQAFQLLTFPGTTHHQIIDQQAR